MSNETSETAGKRVVALEQKKGLSVYDLMLTAVLLAAGAVLKFFVGQFFTLGVKPNFIIAMYCLIILLIRPRVQYAAIIGLIAGAVCQFFPGTPFINFASEAVGAVVMGLLLRIPLKTGPVAENIIKTIAATFVSTLASGFVYVGMMWVMFYSGAITTPPTALGVFAGIIIGTAAINALIVQILYPPLKRVLKR